MLKMWKNYGIKFFWLHTENLVSKFCCIVMDMKRVTGRVQQKFECSAQKISVSENDEESGKFRMLYNKELCDLYKSPVIVS